MQNFPPFRHVNFSPDREELRRFAIAMLVGFALLGLLTAWRRHGFATPTFVLWAVGGALALAALVPGLGRAAYLLVHLPSSLVGYGVSHVILTLVFFLIFTPLGVLLRLLGKDLLARRVESARWREPRGEADRISYYRQF